MSSTFDYLPCGTLFYYKKKLFCLQQGLDGRIIVDVDTGAWHFARCSKFRKIRIVFQPSAAQ